MAELSFNSRNHEDMKGDFAPIPAGQYIAQIISSKIQQTNAGDGEFIKLQAEVIQGEYQKRLIFVNLNIKNPSTVAVEIGQKELATLCRAVNVLDLQDTNQLHNIPFIATVGITEARGKYDAQNKIVNYAPYENTGAVDFNPTKADVSNDQALSRSDRSTDNNQSVPESNSKPPWLKEENAVEPAPPFNDDDVPF